MVVWEIEVKEILIRDKIFLKKNITKIFLLMVTKLIQFLNNQFQEIKMLKQVIDLIQKKIIVLIFNKNGFKFDVLIMKVNKHKIRLIIFKSKFKKNKKNHRIQIYVKI